MGQIKKIVVLYSQAAIFCSKCQYLSDSTHLEFIPEQAASISTIVDPDKGIVLSSFVY